jgi:hypothetical protein
MTYNKVILQDLLDTYDYFKRTRFLLKERDYKKNQIDNSKQHKKKMFKGPL